MSEGGKVHPSSRPGGWHVERGYRPRARLLLKRAEEAAAKVQEFVKQAEEARQKGNQYVFQKEQLEEYRYLTDATVLFAAMAVEGFLNFYGVVRLGEEFYTNNYERLSPQQKVSALVATCLESLLPPEAELLKVVRRLFERRNSLVHPKAREMKDTDPWPPPATTRLADAKASVADMEEFFAIFADLDKKAEWAM